MGSSKRTYGRVDRVDIVGAIWTAFASLCAAPRNALRRAVQEHSRFRAISPIAVDLSVGHDAGMRRKQRGLWAGTIGSLLCPYCGEEGVEQRRPSASERFRHWLLFGGPAPVTTTCVNGHEWEGGSQSSLYRVRTGGPRWLWLPVELVRVVHRDRSMVPVPLTYVAAAGRRGVSSTGRSQPGAL